MKRSLARLLLGSIVSIGAPFLVIAASADVVPNHLFSDHMMLQQGQAVPVWGTADAGEKITVTIEGQNKSTVAKADGTWSVSLDPVWSAHPIEMTIAGDNTVVIHDVLVGEVWLCSGQSNMDFTLAKSKKRPYAGVTDFAKVVAAANDPQLRVYTTDWKLSPAPQQDTGGQWVACTPQTAGGISAVGYYFGEELRKTLGQPIGLIICSRGGSSAQAWISRPALSEDPNLHDLLAQFDKTAKLWSPADEQAEQDAQKQFKIEKDQAEAEGKPAPTRPKIKSPYQDVKAPTALFNGMIAPVIPYAIRGVIWYQGESNIDHPENYAFLMSALIRNWRSLWGQGNFPFIYVQLPNYQDPNDPTDDKTNWARLRDQQASVLSLPNTSMAVAIDVGLRDILHPPDKADVGKRLALLAEKNVYHRDVIASGPVFDTATIEGDTVRVHFTSVNGGLKIHGDQLNEFALAGADGIWYPAQAKIDGDSVVVSDGQIKTPLAVSYAWSDAPVASLFDGASLPARPFRFDLPPAK